MEAKKTPKANLENRRVLFMEIGLTVALAVVVASFAVGQSEKTVQVIDMQIAPIDEEIIMNTQQEQTPPEVRTQTVQVLSDFINVVRNETNITTVFDWVDPNEGLVIDIPVIEAEEEVEIPVFVAETMPSFQGGDLNTFRNWVQGRLVYPRMAQENNVQGRVVLKFVIEHNGDLTNIEEVASPDKSLTEEAIRVLKTSPKWSPGKQRNKAVRVAYILPIEFRLQS
jgi:protein TonB